MVRGQLSVVRCRSVDASIVWRCPVQAPLGLVPEDELLFSSAADDAAGRVRGEGEYSAGTAVPACDECPFVHVPDPKEAILSGGEQSIGVGRPAERVDGPNVSAQRMEFLPRFGLPDL